MAKYTFDLMDEVINEVLDEIVTLLQQHQVTALSARKTQRMMASNSKCIRFRTKLDTPDSVVTLVSKGNKPYGHHTDTRPCKYDNHDNDDEENPQRHEMFMRIFTLCFSTQSGDIITLQHGMPSSDNRSHLYFKLWGHFCDGKEAFIPCEKGREFEGIKIGGQCHLHIQDVACQGAPHHFIQPIDKKGIRVVHSARSCGPLNLARPGKIEEKFLQPSKLKIIDSGQHTLNNVIEKVTNNVVFPTIVSNPDNPQALPTIANANEARTGNNHDRQQMTIGPSTYRNGELLQDELTKRDCILGLPDSTRIVDIATNRENNSEFLERKISLIYKDHLHIDPKSRKTEKVSILCGPALVSTTDGKKRRVRSGEHIPTDKLTLMTGIGENNSCRGVVDPKRMDFIQLRSLSKNTASVASNLFAALTGGQLNPMICRGVGGALDITGSNPVPSSSKKAKKDACTHTVSHSQQLCHEFTWGMIRAVQRGQLVNVFVFGIFIGLFYVRSVTQREGDQLETILDEIKKMEDILHQLNDLDNIPAETKAAIPKKLNEQDKRQIFSMAAPGVYVELLPSEPKFPIEYPLSKPESECEWNTITLSESDFLRPSLVIDRKAMDHFFWNWNSDTNPPSDASEGTSQDLPSCYSTSTLLAKMRERGQTFPHLTLGARMKLPWESDDGDDDNDCAGDGDGNGAGDVALQDTNTTSTSTFGDVDKFYNALIHSSFWSAEKAYDVNMIDKDTGTMSPPRDYLWSVFGKECYLWALNQLNMKPLIVRPLHPPFPSVLDPVVNMAIVVTNTNTTTRESRGDGAKFILSDDDETAWEIILKCTICTIFNTHALLQITQGKCDIPKPEEMSSFIEKVTKYEWSSRLVHRIFRKCFHSMDDLKTFLEGFSMEGKAIFKEAVTVKGWTRSDIIVHLQTKIRTCTRQDFDNFQLQTLLRVIEVCIKEPFGRVVNVCRGYGSNDALKCFVGVYKEDQKIARRNSTDDLLPDVLRWLLDGLVNRVREAVARDNPFVQDELTVLRLIWSRENDTLLHLDTGKQIDESDIEHFLCSYYILIQHTLPNRNMGKTWRIDCKKYHPVRFDMNGNRAINFPVMEKIRNGHESVREAYKRLIHNGSYPNSALHSDFKIDL